MQGVQFNTKKLTRVSAVAAALAYKVKLPAAATACTDFIVASLLATVAKIMLEVVTKLLVTTKLVAAIAKLTDPDVWLMVRAPVVPAAVIVLLTTILAFAVKIDPS
jgi:hypothetical protein